MPDLSAYDPERVRVGTQYRNTAGANVALEIPVTAGGKYYVQVAPFSGTAGAYSLSITPRQAFDRFEPNDSILEPRDIPFG